MEGMWSLCLPVYREAFAAIAAGAIGEVREIAGSFAVPEPYDPASRFWDPAQGGGALLDRGVYLVGAGAGAAATAAGRVPPTSAGRPSGVDAGAELRARRRGRAARRLLLRPRQPRRQPADDPGQRRALPLPRAGPLPARLVVPPPRPGQPGPRPPPAGSPGSRRRSSASRCCAGSTAA